MDKKVVLITGASAGIGKAAAKTLLDRGFTVHAAARRLEAMAELEAAGAHLHYLDLTDGEAIEHCVTAVLEESGRVDVLINNAGYGSYGAVEEMSMAEARRQFEVNLFGAAQLIQQLLPQMRARRTGRIINVTSIGGKVWSLFGGWYQATKFAMEGFSDCLRNELWPFGIEVVVIEPGAIKTEWASTAADNLLKVSGAGAYGTMAQKAAAFYRRTDEQNGVDPQVIANTILKAVTSAKPRPRYVAPASARFIIFLRWLLSDRLFDRFMRRLFAISPPSSQGQAI